MSDPIIQTALQVDLDMARLRIQEQPENVHAEAADLLPIQIKMIDETPEEPRNVTANQ
jgi:hypothetical protein